MKKMKNLIISIVIGVVTVLLTTIGTIWAMTTESNSQQKNETEDNVSEWYQLIHDGENVSLMIENEDQFNRDIDDLTVYDFHLFRLRYASRKRPIPEVDYCGMHDLRSLNKTFPIERIEKIDDNNIDVVYKLQDEKYGQATVYVRCTRQYENYWALTGEIYYISNKLSSEDFSSIEIGDSMERVIAIDPSTILETFEEAAINASIGDFSTYSYRLLTDGILRIEFKSPDPSAHLDVSSYVVSDMKFYPYGSEPLPEYVTATKFPDSFR